MAEKLSNMGFQSSMADPDVWLLAATKGHGEKYYKNVLMSVDDILAVLCEAKAIPEEIQTTFKLKIDWIEAPEFKQGRDVFPKIN